MSKLTGIEMNPTKTCKRGDFTTADFINKDVDQTLAAINN